MVAVPAPTPAMAPMGNIYFHPDGGGWSEDFAKEPLGAQAFFIHEMTHVWQAQKGPLLSAADAPPLLPLRL